MTGDLLLILDRLNIVRLTSNTLGAQVKVPKQVFITSMKRTLGPYMRAYVSISDSGSVCLPAR